MPQNLRLLFPQWQGGDNVPYYLGSQLLGWLAPKAQGAQETVPVTEPQLAVNSEPLPIENGITARSALVKQLASAQALIQKHNPDTITTLGGDCLVSLAPFAYLSEKYGRELGVLWVDTHPDIMTPEQYEHAHAHVLGALLGNGDPDLTKASTSPVPASNVLIAGIHSPDSYEQDFLTRNKIQTLSPADIKRHDLVKEWIEKRGIKYLAIHFDLDVLDPSQFRGLLFTKPNRTKDEFGGAPEGQVNIQDALGVIQAASQYAKPVGLTISEHLPWDAVNLKLMLQALPLM